jgi:flagellin-like hook-associated protein FlgL
LGTNAVTGAANIQAFYADYANLSVQFNPDVANNGSGTITLQAGGQTFTSLLTQSFTGNPAATVLTSTGPNLETLTLNLNNLNLVSPDSNGLLFAEPTVLDALKNLRKEDASTNGKGSIVITIGDLTFQSPAASTFGGNPTAILFTETGAGTNAEVLSIDLAALTIGTDAQLTSGAAAIQTAVRGLTYANTFVATATAGTTGAASFQVGTDSDDTIAISISDTRTTNVYRDNAGVAQVLNVSTKGNSTTGAILASAVLDNAINSLTSVRAQVGAAQSRFNFASATLETSVQNLDAARAGFLDADISNESTAFASQQVLIQASISVLAQANQLPQNLLKLIG